MQNFLSRAIRDWVNSVMKASVASVDDFFLLLLMIGISEKTSKVYTMSSRKPVSELRKKE